MNLSSGTLFTLLLGAQIVHPLYFPFLSTQPTQDGLAVSKGGWGEDGWTD